METLGYSAAEVARLVGCSYRQLDYWCRVGLLDPVQPAAGSGSRRRFTPDQVCEVRLLQHLSLVGAWDCAADALAVVRERAEWCPDPWAGRLVIRPDGQATVNGPTHGGACWVVDLAACANPVGLPAPRYPLPRVVVAG